MELPSLPSLTAINPPPGLTGCPAPPVPQILYEDAHLIAVNKPAPLLTQAPPGIPSLEAWVKGYIKAKYAKPAGVYLGIPHRLDRPVSGVIVFARNTKAAQRLHAQFQARSVQKRYWALVAGGVSPDEGTWEDWLVKRAEIARVEPASAETPQARLAITAYRVRDRRNDDSTLVELTPLTGRMHQLRAQAAWRGHPILGDELYTASPRAFGPAGGEPRDRVIALHARQLRVVHPTRQLPITFTAPLPAYWPTIPLEDDADGCA